MINDAEVKREKKANKIFFGVAKMAGVTVGLFILSLIAPLIYDAGATSAMQGLFNKYGLLMMLYIGVMVFTFLFLRKNIVTVNILMRYLYLPSVAIMFVYEAYNIMTGSQ